MRSVQGREQEPREPSETTTTRRVGGQDGRTVSKSPYSPNKESQKEERDSVIDAVKQITGAKQRSLDKGGQAQKIPQSTIGIQDMME